MINFGFLLLQQSKNNPYVLQHKLSPEFEVLVDGTTYGNDSRLVLLQFIINFTRILLFLCLQIL